MRCHSLPAWKADTNVLLYFLLGITFLMHPFKENDAISFFWFSVRPGDSRRLFWLFATLSRSHFRGFLGRNLFGHVYAWRSNLEPRIFVEVDRVSTSILSNTSNINHRR